MQIQNISLIDHKGVRTGLTGKIDQLKVGQSFFVETNYTSAYACIGQAKRRLKSPLKGKFRIVKEGDGVRVGRIE